MVTLKSRLAIAALALAAAEVLSGCGANLIGDAIDDAVNNAVDNGVEQVIENAVGEGVDINVDSDGGENLLSLTVSPIQR
jgi:dihydropteroate synthase